MSANRSADRLTEVHRLAQVRLGARVAALADGAWRLLDIDNLDATTARWLLANRVIVDSHRVESARLSAAYLRAHKLIELPGGRPSPVVMAGTVEPVSLATSLTVTGPVVVKEAFKRGETARVAFDLGRQRATAAAVRHTINAGRETIERTVQSDSEAVGWVRRTSGKPCAFCAMLAARGPVYKSEGSGGFKPHDHCYCQPEPSYSTDTPWPSANRRLSDAWNQAQIDARESGDLNRGTSNDALNAFRRALNH